jgi:hypothetical protein
MSVDARRNLEVDVAHLRLALREGGLPLDVKGGRAYTPELRALVERGDIAIDRAARGSHRPSLLFTTPQGVERLAGILERYGEDFGPISVLGTVENVRRR